METAELAQVSRDADTLLRIASSDLGPLSLFCEAIGLNRRGDTANAERLARELIEQGPSGFKAKALIILANNQQSSDPDHSLALYEQARVLADDPGTALTITKMRAVVTSRLGDHKRALHTLEDGISLLRLVRYNPPLCSDFLNSLAVEYANLGKFDLARQLCQLTTSSPYAGRFPEWTETAAGVWEKEQRGRKMCVNVPRPKATLLKFTPVQLEPPGVSTILLRYRAAAVVSGIVNTELLACIANLETIRGPNLELLLRACELDPALAQAFLNQIEKHDSLPTERVAASEN